MTVPLGTEHKSPDIRTTLLANAIAPPQVLCPHASRSFIATKLGLKQIDPDLKKAAIWTYFRDAIRGEGDNEGATIILNNETKEAWFWFIPLADGVTSIGCVADNDYLLKGRGKPEQTFSEERQRCPSLQDRLVNATQLQPVITAKEFSYSTKQSSGQGWVLVGDAFGFIDPVYSSGVYFALETGIRAADAVLDGFQKKDLSEQQLGCWIEDFQNGAMWVRKLINTFYDNRFRFGRFMKEHPEHRSSVTDLLIGRIFEKSHQQLFDDIDDFIARTA